MATYTKELLSGSTDGAPIGIAATSTPGTLIHTADLTALDEVYIYAVNTSASDVTLTVEFGGVGAADLVPMKIKKNAGLTLVIPGTALTGAKVVGAYAGVGSVINIQGWVNRITP